MAFVNNLFYEHGSWCFRGAGWDGEAYRFQNNSLKFCGPSKPADDEEAAPNWNYHAQGWKLWGPITGIEILDNVVDGNPRAWYSIGGAYGVFPCQCTQNWTIRGNVLKDLSLAISLQGDAGPPYCQSRPLDNVVIDRNIIRNTYKWGRRGAIGISIRGNTLRGKGKENWSETATTKNVIVTNNFISSTTPWKAAIFLMVGTWNKPSPGLITIAGNTLCGPFNAENSSAVLLRDDFTHMRQDIIFKNNIIAGAAAGPNILAK